MIIIQRLTYTRTTQDDK